MKFLLVFIMATLLVSRGNTQEITLRGIVTDYDSLYPLGNVNVSVKKSDKGTVSDARGRFSVRLAELPCAITLTCVGYEPLWYEIRKAPAGPVELVMKRKTTVLPEVDIMATNFSTAFKDDHYSVLDYEFSGDLILLLVFRYQLKKSELIAITHSGDTVFISEVPEQKPKRLYRDFLGNIHYVSTRGNAFECIYDEHLNNLVYPWKITFDSLVRMANPFLFTTGGLTWFEEAGPGGYGKVIGYFDREKKKKYVRHLRAATGGGTTVDDARFNAMWNQMAGVQNDGNPLAYRPIFSDDDYRANRLFFFQQVKAPVVKLEDDRLAIFNFSGDAIELMTSDGRSIGKVPIDFHKEANGNLLAGLVGVFLPAPQWEWCGRIFIDDYFREGYTAYRKSGMVKIRKIDMDTGKLNRSWEIPVPFPEKIGILMGEAYFLYRVAGSEPVRWNLGKIRL